MGDFVDRNSQRAAHSHQADYCGVGSHAIQLVRGARGVGLDDSRYETSRREDDGEQPPLYDAIESLESVHGIQGEARLARFGALGFRYASGRPFAGIALVHRDA